MHRCPNRLSLGAVAAWLALAPPALRAQAPPDENEIQGRGFSPERLYNFEDIDSINLFSGNLSLTIPLGGRYPVGGRLSYGFVLSYNSHAWTYHECPFPLEEEHREAVATPLANSGAGWMVSFGYLVPPGHTILNEEPNAPWLWISSDGGQHYLFNAPHTEDAPVAGVSYGRDNTYARLREDAGGPEVHELDLPDSTTYTFDVGVHDNTVWEVTAIRDAFGNQVTVDRTAPDTNHWTVSDDHGRTHEIVFEASGASGLTRPRIKSITLEGFEGQNAVYSFNYATTSPFIDRGCRDTCVGNAAQVQVPLLTSITLPSGEQYSLGTQASPDYELTCSAGASGRARSTTLPTLGKIAWTWGSFCTPRDRVFGGMGGGIGFTCDAGVKSRKLFSNAGTLEGEWQYDNGIHPDPGSCNPGPGQCPNATESRTVVVYPTMDCAKHYFAADPVAANATWSYGLPFSSSTQSGGLFLSTETWLASVPTGDIRTQFLQTDCAQTPAGGGSPLRSTHVLYDKDTLPPLQFEDGREFHNTNRRLKQSKTVFSDATHCGAGSATCEVTTSSNHTPTTFDGQGHYRQTDFGGNFPGTNARTTLTNYNPTAGIYPGAHTHPSPSSPWILETFDKTEVTESANTARVEYCFEASTGFLLRRRHLLDTLAPLARNGKDVLAVFVHGPSGNLTRERYFGGDTAPTINTGTLCTLGLPAGSNVFDYQVEHSYDFGALEKSFYAVTDAGGSIGFRIFDVDRDASTGLVARSRDSSSLIPTDFDYDAMGRLTAEIPAEAPAQRVRTDYTYTNAVGLNPAEVLIEKKSSGGALLAESEVAFDGIGRVAAERRLMADGTTASRTSTYNARGWPLTKSEWSPACTAPCGVTTFGSYDPFGRPGSIAAPDGTPATTFDYDGVSRLTRTVNVQGAGNVQTREVYDRFGRLRSVEEPLGTSNAFTYSYDEGDRLVSVTSDPGSALQTRTFDYDGRGFLLSETHAELGGAVQYTLYDARGHAGNRKQLNGAATFQELLLAYDKAERLLSVTDAVPSPDRSLKNFAYDGAGTTRLDGRLQQAVRHNWLNMPWDGTSAEVDMMVTETYAYDGPGGAVSRRSTLSNIESITFVTDWTYDQLGNVATTAYPDCQGGTTCPSPAEPARTVTHTYTNGLLTRVVGVEGVNTVEHADAISYHPNGLWAQIDRGSSPGGESPVADVQTIATHRMRRPQRLQVTGAVGTGDFDTGTYGYDAAGNVTGMGTDSFSYDNRSRLASTNVHGYAQSFTYDFYGNLTSYVTTPPGGGPATTTINTNILTNRLSGGTPTATYDAAGNLTMLAGHTYKYDALNMETQRNPSGAEPQWTNVYTADDERFWILVHNAGPPPGESPTGSSQEIYVRDLSGKVLRQFKKVHPTTPPPPSQLWTWSQDYVYRDGTPLSTHKTGTGVVYHHVDHLGTIRQTTGALGVIQSSPDYLPFGEGAPASPTAQALQHTGHEREMHAAGELDNLDYLHARYRAPVYARFMSVDPVVNLRRSGRRPQSWNRYSYALDNPLKYVDPTGQIFVLSGCAGRDQRVCEQQAHLLYKTLGPQAAQHISLNTRTGVVSVVGMSTAAFGQKFGTFARGLGELVGSRDTFSLVTDNPQMAARGQGAYTQLLRGGGANIYIDPSRFPTHVGGVRQTTSTALAHETGHGVGSLFPALRRAVNEAASGRPLLFFQGEGYPVTFENRYRAEAGLPIREFYQDPGDYRDPGDVSLFPEDQ